jgi:hypothetical protein
MGGPMKNTLGGPMKVHWVANEEHIRWQRMRPSSDRRTVKPTGWLTRCMLRVNQPGAGVGESWLMGAWAWQIDHVVQRAVWIALPAVTGARPDVSTSPTTSALVSQRTHRLVFQSFKPAALRRLESVCALTYRDAARDGRLARE